MRKCRLCAQETPDDDMAVAYYDDATACICWACVGRVAGSRPVVSRRIQRDIEEAAQAAEKS